MTFKASLINWFLLMEFVGFMGRVTLNEKLRCLWGHIKEIHNHLFYSLLATWPFYPLVAKE